MLGFRSGAGRASAMIVMASLIGAAACKPTRPDPSSSTTGAGGADAATSGDGATSTVDVGAGGATSGAPGVTAGVTTSSAAVAASAASAASAAATAGAGGCAPGSVPANTLRGTVTYPGVVGAKDVLRVFALKNVQPGNPAGSVEIANPTFPTTYEISGLPADPGAGTLYGVMAYVDLDGDSPSSPGDTDPRAIPAMVGVISDCSGATLDVAIP